MNNFFGHTSKVLCLLISLLMAAIPAKAQEADKFKVNFGLQATVSVPVGKIDYKEYYGKLGITNGYGVGVFVEFAWSRFAVRGQIEYLDFEKYKNEHNADVKGSHTMAIIDCVFFTKAKYLHYIFAGLGVSEPRISNWRTLGGGDVGEPHTEAAPFYGLGWNLNKRYGIEIKHVPDLDGDSWIQASVLLRF